MLFRGSVESRSYDFSFVESPSKAHVGATVDSERTPASQLHGLWPHHVPIHSLSKEFSFFCRPCWVGQKKHWGGKLQALIPSCLSGSTLQESDSSRPQLSELQNGDNNALLGIHHVEVSEMLGFMSITISRPSPRNFQLQPSHFHPLNLCERLLD